MEANAAAVYILDNYGEKFERIFGTSIAKFIDPLLAFIGVPGFDILKFNDYLELTEGYDIKKHGSLKSYVKNNYGERASELIDKLIHIESNFLKETKEHLK